MYNPTRSNLYISWTQKIKLNIWHTNQLTFKIKSQEMKKKNENRLNPGEVGLGLASPFLHLTS